MKNTILLATILMIVTIPLTANAHGHSSSSVSINVRGGHGAFYYSHQSYNRRVVHHRTVIRHGGYHGGHHGVYYGGYYGSGRSNHIHRQEGRRYVNDFPCAPVVVVPSTYRHRHYRGCGCR